MKQTNDNHGLDLMPINQRFSVDTGKLLGAGAYGKVFMGFDEVKKNVIAVKNVNKFSYMQFKELIQREIEVMKKLDHRNIIQFYDSIVDSSDGMFMFIQLCLKQNLEKRIIDRLTEQETFSLFQQLVEGMFYMNSKNIFHRDLKPENLLISIDSKTLKIADLGIARQYQPKEVNIRMTRRMGTPMYAAPQVIFGNSDYNEKCDVYSAGCILYEMLTSQKIVERENKNNMKLFQFLKEKQKRGGWKIDHPAIINKSHWMQLLNKMLEFKPEKRISFSEIKQFLKKVKPSDSLPLARTVAQEESDLSKKEKTKIEEALRHQLDTLDSLLGVLKIIKQLQNGYIWWFPSVYRLIIFYICSILYIRKNNGLTDIINSRDNTNQYKESYHRLIRQDRALITTLLTDIIIKLNSQKQQIKNFSQKKIGSKIKLILKDKYFKIQNQLLQQIPNFTKIHECFTQNTNLPINQSCIQAIKYTINNLFKSKAQISVMSQLQLRLYYLLVSVSDVNFRENFKWAFVSPSIKRKSYQELKSMNIKELCKCVDEFKKS